MGGRGASPQPVPWSRQGPRIVPCRGDTQPGRRWSNALRCAQGPNSRLIGSVFSTVTIREVTGSLLTADQVAELLGVPKTWVYEQSRTGRIPTVTLGRYRRYRREAIEAWVEQLEGSLELMDGLSARARPPR